VTDALVQLYCKMFQLFRQAEFVSVVVIKMYNVKCVKVIKHNLNHMKQDQ